MKRAISKQTAIKPPKWFIGRRKRQLYAAIIRELAVGAVKVKASQGGLCGFASALEYLEILVRIGADRHSACNEAFEWAEALLLSEDAAGRLLKEVGVL